MRYINPSDVEAKVAQDWLDSADTALQGLRQCTAQQRSAFIDARQHLWKNLKADFAAISSQKCWFCESKNIRADNAVDHFRPKNAVAEDPTHDGYWWLAFNWRNYRFICAFCNSLHKDPKTGKSYGKHTHFPLLSENLRAKCEQDNCASEQPLLLDPCCQTDPPHLWFEEDGTVVTNPSVCGAADSFASARANASMDCYHLRHGLLVEERKIVCQKAKLDALEAEKMIPLYDMGDMTARAAVETAVNSLKDTLKADQAYSRAVRCTMMFLRASSRVAAMVLEAA